MFDSYKFSVAEKFIRYVKIDTQSDPQNLQSPSTEKQKILSTLLARELQQIGAAEVSTDVYGYVYATIPSNSPKKIPVICFCSHIDTAPDCSGFNVKPIIHKNFQGLPIVLPDDTTQVITVEDYPYLKNHIGQDIITASGTTLLGADDKSGIAIIMEMAQYLLSHPEILHGEIKLLFTTDEEVGRGTDNIDLEKLSADFAYTLDGGEAGTLEDETFSANSVEIIIHGVSAHPGYAQNKMINAIKIAAEIIDALPKKEWSPENTSHRQGFVHPLHITGTTEKASVHFIIRDFNNLKLNEHEIKLESLVNVIMQKYSAATYEFIVTEQYRNMKEILDKHPQVLQFAVSAYQRAGLSVVNEPIRGGTDGSRLSFMGLPCPNLFTGMQAIHSKQEWIGVKDMEKAVEVLIFLVQEWEINSQSPFN